MMIERGVSRLPMHRSESSAVSVDRTKMVLRRLRYDGKPVDVCLCGFSPIQGNDQVATGTLSTGGVALRTLTGPFLIPDSQG